MVKVVYDVRFTIDCMLHNVCWFNRHTYDSNLTIMSNYISQMVYYVPYG